MEFNKGKSADELLELMNRFGDAKKITPSQTFTIFSELQKFLQNIYDEGLTAGFLLKTETDKKFNKN